MTKKVRAVLLELLAILVMLYFLAPFWLVYINASKSMKEISKSVLSFPQNPMLIFENIQRVFENTNVMYASSFVSSGIITILSVAFIILTASMAAWVLVRTRTKISAFFFMMFVAAMVIPFQVVMFPLVQWYKVVGDFLHITLRATYVGMIFAYVGFGASLSIFLFHGFIKGIPEELEEAAHIDGCTRPGIFFRIILPLLKPISITVLILNGIWIWNDYLLPLMILGVGNPVQTLPLAVANFAGSFLKKWDLILTAALMAMVPIIIVYLFCQKYIIRGMTDGAIK